LTDRRAAGSDTLATSYILLPRREEIGRYDFGYAAGQAIDGDTGKGRPQLA
jgi:electron transfer flavoprotein beta subunit